MAVFSFTPKKQASLQALLDSKEGLSYLEAMTAPDMLKEADRLLKNKDRKRALSLIRSARDKMVCNRESDMADLLYAARLLQEAGRKNEAWMFLVDTKDFFYQRCADQSLPHYQVMSTESAISSAMSDFLYKEKNLSYSFYMAVKSYLEDTSSTFYLMNEYMKSEIIEKNPKIKAGYIQARKQAESYMNIKISDSYIKNILFSHLARVHKKEKLNAVLALVKDTIASIPRVDYIKLEEDLLTIMKTRAPQA